MGILWYKLGHRQNYIVSPKMTSKFRRKLWISKILTRCNEVLWYNMWKRGGGIQKVRPDREFWKVRPDRKFTPMANVPRLNKVKKSSHHYCLFLFNIIKSWYRYWIDMGKFDELLSYFQMCEAIACWETINENFPLSISNNSLTGWKSSNCVK